MTQYIPWILSWDNFKNNIFYSLCKSITCFVALFLGVCVTVKYLDGGNNIVDISIPRKPRLHAGFDLNKKYTFTSLLPKWGWRERWYTGRQKKQIDNKENIQILIKSQEWGIWVKTIQLRISQDKTGSIMIYYHI